MTKWEWETNHRYILRRSWIGTGGVVNFIMLNPSTADDIFDDPTIRRCIGFSRCWGYSGIVVTNLYAFRATNPDGLRELLHKEGGWRLAVGMDSHAHLDREARNAALVVCAWGDNCDMSVRVGCGHRDLDVIQMLRSYDLYCIRLTKKGNPVHPVREPYTKAPLLFHPKLIEVPA